MTKLTTKARKAIPTKNFAGPDRSYPINDPNHARNALARVANKSPELKAKVRAKVHAKYPSIGKSASQPHPETNPGFYDTEPHAPANKIADKPNIQNASLGNETPKMVPHSPGRFDGLGGSPHHFGHPPAGSTHGFGHAQAMKVGHIRLSGHSGAHRIGKRGG